MDFVAMCTKGKERKENVSKAFGSVEKARLFLGKKKKKATQCSAAHPTVMQIDCKSSIDKRFSSLHFF